MGEAKSVNKTTVALKPEVVKKANELMQVYKTDLNMTIHRTQLVELLINEAYSRVVAKK